jgi:hypothetical protein
MVNSVHHLNPTSSRRAWLRSLRFIAKLKLTKQFYRRPEVIREAMSLTSPVVSNFVSEGGKVWPRIKAVAEANNCVAHIL